MSRLLFRRDKYPAVDRTSFVRYCSTAAMNTGLFLASRLDTRIFISFREHLPAEKISPVHLLTCTGTGSGLVLNSSSGAWPYDYWG